MSPDQGFRLSAGDLAAMGWRARTLDERLAAAPTDGERGEDGPDPLALWARAFARGDREALQRRLAWDGLDQTRVRRALAGSAPPDTAAPPRWALDLAGAYAGGGEAESDPLAEQVVLRGGAPPPFWQLWLPLVRSGRARLEAGCPPWSTLLSPTARRERERHLLERLANLAALAALERFESYRERHCGSKTPPANAALNQGDELYRAFVAAMLSGELARLLVELPVLARHLQLLLDTWCETTAELLERLLDDLPSIQETMGLASPPGSVTGVASGLSDRHHGGRQVAALTFERGLQLVYKPRPVDLELAFAELLGWLARRGLEPAPVAPRTVAGDGYAWVELVPQATLGSLAEANRHYRQAGALLCLAWLLGGSDLHMENVVAGPQGPVLVDLETLLQPRLAAATAAPPNAMARAAAQVQSSALATGLMGFFQLDANGRSCDIGGFSGRGGYLVASAARCFRHVNRDGMHLSAEPAYAEPEKNLPLVNGRPVGPDAHGDDVARGFTDAYELLLADRDGLLALEGPLAPFTRGRTRVVLRPSHRYALLQHVLASPRYQRDGLTRSVMVDALNSAAASRPTRPPLWALVAEERDALERLDIPYLSLPVDSTELVAASGEAVRGHFDRSGLDCLWDRLRAMGAEDLRQQLELVRSALASPADGALLSSHDRVMVSDGPPTPETHPPLPGDQLESAALSLADEIARRATRGEDGSATWIAPSFMRREGRTDHGAPYYLYGGAAGVALFLAAAGRVAPAGGFTELARAACQPLETVLSNPGLDLLLANEGPGAGNGLGGIVFALVWMAELTGDSDFLGMARRVAEQITPQRIATDLRLDVEGGAAGGILGLLALHRRVSESWVLDRAIACGQHLLARQTPAALGGAAWPGGDGLMRAGFAHGAAGVSCALHRLADATGESRFAAAARKGVAYERRLFSPRRGNWPVLERGPSGGVEKTWMTAWCHGAPGVALGRATVAEALDDAETLHEVEIALSTTLATGTAGPDHLCCGTLGRVDVVVTCGDILRRDDLVGRALGLAGQVVRRSTERGGFDVNQVGRTDAGFRPGLFRGLAGVGYQLLRLARPTVIPSVLAFQAPAAG